MVSQWSLKISNLISIFPPGVASVLALTAVGNKTFYNVDFSNNRQFRDNVVEFYLLQNGHELYSHNIPHLIHARDLVIGDIDQIKYGLKNGVHLSYSKFETHLLEPSYVTECRHYPKSHFQSYDHCFIACMLNKTIELFNEIPFADYYKNQTSKYKYFNRRTSLGHLAAICRDTICTKVDCHSEHYVPNLVTTYANDFLKISILCPNNPDIISSYQPLLTIVDYVTYILSTVGFWTGFDPMAILIYGNWIKFLTNGRGGSRRKKKNNSHSRLSHRVN